MWRRPGSSSAPRGRALFLGLTVLATSLLAGLPMAASAATIADTVSSAVAAPRVFEPGTGSDSSATTLHYVLLHPTRTTVEIVDYASKRVRLLKAAAMQDAGAYDLAWDGRVAAGGGLVQDGGYRFRLTVADGLGSFFVDRPMTKAPAAIFPVAPESITVAIDPGHGGPDPGAIRPPLAEKTANLDIALRLRAMLVGAGVKVVMTRTGDTKVNGKKVDWTRDGKVGYRDELASRIEIANKARADVFVVVHNNGTPPGVGGTETWYDPTRPFGAINKTLATYVQQGLIKSLKTLSTSTWKPTNRGIHQAPFYVLRKYKIHFDERPSQMPGILGESLAMGNKHELVLLRQSRGKQAIAAGYYSGLVRFFAGRTWGAKYDLLAGPGASAVEGSPKVTKIRVTNTSPQAWAAGAVSLTLSAVLARPWYDGTDAPGTRLATITLPALASGASVNVDVPFTVPSYASVSAPARQVILKADLLADTLRLARAGVPPLQQILVITSAGPTPPPTPSPTPTASPSASPSVSPSPSPSTVDQGTGTDTTTPTAAPSASPSAAPSASPSVAPPTPSPAPATPTASPTPAPTAAPSEPPPATPSPTPTPSPS
jgi:N-acetylmuramoyl-L-alanine amidase